MDHTNTVEAMNHQIETLKKALEEKEKILAVEIHRRKKAEAEMHNHLKFKTIVENLLDVYFETTLDGKIKDVSPSAESVSGYSVKELIGNTVFMLYHDPNDRKGLLKELEKYDRIRGYEVLFKKKSGECYDVSINADIYTGENGKPVGMIGTIRDITWEKQLKEELHRSKKMESLGLMAGGIAHDLNNILSGIVSYPDLLLRHLPEESPMRRRVEVIKDSGLRAAAVVADLLTVAKGSAMETEVMNLNRTVSEFFESSDCELIVKKFPYIRFSQHLDPNLLNIRGSSSHIKKILLNLVANASEAIDTFGNIKVKTENRYLDEPIRRYERMAPGEYVLLVVSDTGAGISDKDIDRIFEPFYTKKVMGRKGTGLGLAVVWNTVQDHHGYIDVISSNEGTSIEIYFPASRELLPVQGLRIPDEAYAGCNETILVVDDEQTQREIAASLLEQLGYCVESVPNGEEAVAYVEKTKPDLIILDMIMGKGMNGREAYEKIIQIHPHQKAIIASGFSMTEDVMAAQRMGAGAYLRKPYTIEKLGQAVKAELEKSL